MPSGTSTRNFLALLDLFKIVAPSLIAAFLSGYLVSRWKTREDAIEKRLDEICSEIKAVAEDAASYWQKQPDAPETKMLAAKVQAGLARVDGLRSVLAGFVSRAATEEMAEKASFLLRTATGDDFGVHNRPADIERAAHTYQAAAALLVVARKARMKDLAGWRRRR